MKSLKKMSLASIVTILLSFVFTCNTHAETITSSQENTTNLWPLIIIFGVIALIELVIIAIEIKNIELTQNNSFKHRAVSPLYLLFALIPEAGLLIIYIELAVDILLLFEILILLIALVKNKKSKEIPAGLKKINSSITELTDIVSKLSSKLDNLEIKTAVIEGIAPKAQIKEEKVVEEVKEEPLEIQAENEEAEESAGLYLNEDGSIRIDNEYPEFFNEMIDDLSREERETFKKVVADGGIRSSIRRPMKEMYRDEAHFLLHLFSSTAFRGMLSVHTFETFYEILLKYLRTEYEIAMLGQKMVNIYYLHRNEEEYLAKFKDYALKDIDHQLNVMNVQNDKLNSIKKLITIYTQEGNYDQAIRFCDIAIEHSLIDFKEEGYEKRKADIISKKEKEEAKALKALQPKKRKKRKTSKAKTK